MSDLIALTLLLVATFFLMMYGPCLVNACPAWPSSISSTLDKTP